MTGSLDITHLAFAARLFGRLLVRELDADTLRELASEPIAGALGDLGITVPKESDLDSLAADYFRCLLHPTGHSPPIHSLFREGRYHGDPAVAVAAIATRAGCTLGHSARGAAPDHLGCILLLWAEIRETHPDLAAWLLLEHLDWVDRALAPQTRDVGFYAEIAQATVELVRELRRLATERAID